MTINCTRAARRAAALPTFLTRAPLALLLAAAMLPATTGASQALPLPPPVSPGCGEFNGDYDSTLQAGFQGTGFYAGDVLSVNIVSPSSIQIYIYESPAGDPYTAGNSFHGFASSPYTATVAVDTDATFGLYANVTWAGASWSCAPNSAPDMSTFPEVDVPENTTAVATITADDDSGPSGLTWTIGGGADNALFEVDASTGELSFITAPDFEIPADSGGDNVYNVEVVATDAFGLSDSVNMIITVTDDEDEVAANSPPKILAPLPIVVRENTTDDVYDFEAIDDTDASEDLRWSISGTDAAVFAIDESTGVLRFVSPPDFENPDDFDGDNYYELTIHVQDTGDAYGERAIGVGVRDEDEDSINPQVTITGVPANSNAPFTATFTFDEDVTGFDLSDVNAALDNATATEFSTITAMLVFTALITPTAPGTVTVGVDAGAAEDLASNANDAAISATSLYDNIGPSVEILGAPATLSDLTPFTVTIQFDEDVTGFVSGEVTVGNATAGAVTPVDADTYTVPITPSGTGEVTIDVAAGVAEDAASNPNTAATQVIVGNTIIADTQDHIETFISDRAQQIIQSQPDLVDRLTRGNGGGSGSGGPLGFVASGDLSNYALGFATSLNQLSNPALDEVMRMAPGEDGTGTTYSPFDVWVEGSFSRAENGNSDSSFAAAHFGLDFLVNPDLLIGLMGQLDWTAQEDLVAGTAADGLGWMVGPYIVARLQDHLYFDATVLGGQSYNHIDPLGLYVDSFQSTRWLARAKLTGKFTMDEWTFSPFVSGSFFTETQHEYVDSLSNTIPEQTISQGSVAFGPRVSYLIDGETVDIVPSLGLVGAWNFNIDRSGVTTSQWAARIEGGLDFRLDSGATLNTKGFYDGIGVANRQSYGASAGLSVPLQ